VNERLKELYRHAHSIRHYDGDPALDGNPPTVYWQGEASAERFAELIVRECANIAESFHHHQYDFTGNLELHEFIKTHFGVEE
jgi:hypothetical protein